MEQSMNQDPIEELLELRRRAAGEVVDVDEPHFQIVVFRLGDDLWAMRGGQVREILPPMEPFFVPGCPDSIEGVINVRGDIASVIRLDLVLGCRPDNETDKPAHSNSILLGQSEGMITGLRVGEVLDVLELPQSAILAPPSNLSESLRPFVEGAFTYRESPVTLLDLVPLLSRFRTSLE